MQIEKIHRAGVIPYIIENDEIIMMFMIPSEPTRLYCGDSPQIGKGKIEDHETAEQAALREGREELGLFSGNINNFINLGVFMGRTTVFVAAVDRKDMFGEPHHETDSVKWMTMEEFKASGRPLHVPVVKAAYRRIKKIEQLNNKTA